MIYKCKPVKVELYNNTGRKTVAQIKAETGCDLIFNGGLYDMSTFKACCDVRIGGVTLSKDDCTYWGYGWMRGSLPQVMASNKITGVDDYMSCVWAIHNGAKETLNNNAPGIGGVRARTAFGFTADGEMVVLCVSDGSSALSLTGARDVLYDAGCVSAIILDGGGSSQIICPTGTISSARIVSNLVCVWLEKKEDKPVTKIPKPDWFTTRWAVNSDGYKYNGAITGPKGLLVHSTAMPGYDADAIFNNFNAPNRGASIHGCLDNKKGYQMMPFSQRAGHVGSGSRGTLNNTFLGFEFCEPSGLKYNSNGSAIISYNPPAGYFSDIKAKAIHLYAWLCQEYNINPLQHDANGGIVAHYEAYALGYGGNHADVRHWWEAMEGYTMDMFRRDVDNFMKNYEEDEDDMTQEKFNAMMDVYLAQAVKTPPGDWAKESCDKAVNKGIIKGDGTGAYNWPKPMTREAMIVVLDRMGLL